MNADHCLPHDTVEASDEFTACVNQASAAHCKAEGSAGCATWTDSFDQKCREYGDIMGIGGYVEGKPHDSSVFYQKCYACVVLHEDKEPFEQCLNKHAVRADVVDASMASQKKVVDAIKNAAAR